MAKQSNQVQASLQTDPASLFQTPIGLQTQREGSTGSWGGHRRAEEEQGSSCTNSFSMRQNLLRRLQVGSPDVRLHGGKKALRHTISLEHC